MDRKGVARSTAIVLIVVVVVGAVVFWTISRHADKTPSVGWPATKVAIATVARIEIPHTLQAVGELEAVQQVELASETSGRIVRLAFASGQRAEKGQLLVQINDAPEQADRQRLLAQLRNAEAVLARTRQLQAEKVATQEQLDNAQAARDMVHGDLQRVEAVIAQKAIRAPFAGVVGIRHVHEGQYLNAGDSIASLVDAGMLHVNFALQEQATPQLQPGQKVEVQVDAWPERTFTAKVNAIDPLIGKSRTVQVQASVPNANGALRAGMFATARLLQSQPLSVLAVPETAVSYAAYGQTVFVAQADEHQALTVRRVTVKTGDRWDGRVEITAGLKAGDQVVVSGQIKLSDGMRVEPVAHNALHDPQPAAANPEGRTK